MIARAAELLPIHGPISAFVFLNALQGLEHLPFHDALKEGRRLYGSEPYLSEDAYREKMSHGRICREDLADVLRFDLGTSGEEVVAGLSKRHDLRMGMLEHPVRTGPPEEIEWFVAETDALQQMRREASEDSRLRIIDETRKWFMRSLSERSTPAGQPLTGKDDLIEDLRARYASIPVDSWSPATWEAVSLQSLWRVCYNAILNVEAGRAENGNGLCRPRDLLLTASTDDSDQLVHQQFIPFCSAFIDQGFASQPLPDRELGFWTCFSRLYRDTATCPQGWLVPLGEELKRLEGSGLSPLEIIRDSVERMGVPPQYVEDFLKRTLLAFRGFGGMIWQMEVRSDRVRRPVPTGTLVEFLAVRLVLDRLACQWIARTALGYEGPLADLPDWMERNHVSAGKAKQPRHIVQRAFEVFQLAQVVGWSVPQLEALTPDQWTELTQEIESFCALERRRIFHVGFERRFRVQALDAIAAHRQHPVRRVPRPKFQSVYCIDTREESFRRHLETVEPHAETFSAAGFFGVPIYFKGVADAHFSTLCPIVARPKHWVTEEVVYSLDDENRRRARTRQLLGQATRSVHLGSRRVAGGALLAAGFGFLATAPLIARVLAPRMTAKIRRRAARFIEPPPVTKLRLERTAAEPGPTPEGIGFTVGEMADFSERLLRDIGLTSGFARLIFLLGHGSFCMNNPHKSAYDCGACCGMGGPNARAIAAFLNDPRVRSILASRGLALPFDTFFMGGMHNTGNDSIVYFDIDSLPSSHIPDFEAARNALMETCKRNAHERCRRFQSAAVDLTPEEAKAHVEERCEDLAQVRPEFGNATNAMCFVGRRGRTRGLYLDRRCFLQSYDPLQDDEEGTILGRILAAVVPVCEGINLMYYFSSVDSQGWACGSKLPHNLVSLMGVMDGAASDLRPGLPWQGVEIHEPIRLLFIIESTPEILRKIMSRNETVRRIIENRWVQLSLIDPQTSEICVYRRGEFIPYVPDVAELPRVSNSIDWYRGQRDHLKFAQVDNALTPDS